MDSIYELDECIRRVSEGQRHARGMFDMIASLDWGELKDKHGQKIIVNRRGVIEVLEYVERLVYEMEA